MKTHMIKADNDYSSFGDNAEAVSDTVECKTNYYKREVRKYKALSVLLFSLLIGFFVCVYFGSRTIAITHEVIAISAIWVMGGVVAIILVLALLELLRKVKE